MYLLGGIADFRSRNPRLEVTARPIPNRKLEGQAVSARTEARKHLPGGDEYRAILNSRPGQNPRKDKPISQWMQEWDQQWNDATRRSAHQGQSSQLTLSPMD